MEPLKAEQAWTVSYDPSSLLEMGEEWGPDSLDVLNGHLAKGDYVVLSTDTQGFYGDMILDFPAAVEESWRVLIKI
jgi:hypothetical protein